ncbi:MAG: glutamine--fructose-6-phosphate transaminase (isomerizing) [Chloroflexota bacterium]|nr:glutamine--fructose-6-phosphate transaminase (isomerizing) [Chloroflexota bacterium]
MCGIFGYVGAARSVPLTVGTALKSLEYRGYDSWGIVWREADRLETIKKIGRVPTSFTFDAVSRIAVGHTRWATHGGVTDANAHPHLDSTGRVAIVHNGVIENAAELRARLTHAPAYLSETDSEIVAHLLGENVTAGASIVDALRSVFPLLQGQNAVIAIDQRDEVIAAAMNVSPLVIGMGPQGAFISSDPFALVGKASEMVIAPNEAIVRLDAWGVRAFSYAGVELPLPDSHQVPDLSLDELGDHSHFMTKEMAEQPGVLRDQIEDVESTTRLAAHIERAEHVVLTGCGSAFYAARIGSTWLSTLTGKRTVAISASEFDEVAPFLNERTLVIAITQSGETADILEAMRTARGTGSPVVALVNVTHSSAARLADDVIPIMAGRERSVLATKSLLAMLSRLLAGAFYVTGTHERAVPSLTRAAQTIEDLSQSDEFAVEVARISEIIANSEHVYIIGKGDGFGVAQEAALKIKEASYVHAEAFAAGELKHGAIALIEPGIPCLSFASDPRFLTDTGTSMQELRSRGGYTIGIGLDVGEGACQKLVIADHGPANVLVQIFVAQQIAFHVALLRNVDPDYPRNLAKSVTVK